MPYVTYTNVDKVNQTVLATEGQGTLRPCWALVYHHYVNRKSLAAPYSRKFALLAQPEGGGGNYGPNSGGFDQLSYGTLTCGRDPIASGAAPSGLSAYDSAGSVLLSWWGGAYANSYTVKRAVLTGGPYAIVASGITDLLTYTDNGLADGSYYYVVTATTPLGESAASNEAKASIGIQLHTRLNFDEGSGIIANDASGNGHSGTLASGTTWVTGKHAGAISLDGSSGYASLPANIMSDVLSQMAPAIKVPIVPVVHHLLWRNDTLSLRIGTTIEMDDMQTIATYSRGCDNLKIIKRDVSASGSQYQHSLCYFFGRTLLTVLWGHSDERMLNNFIISDVHTRRLCCTLDFTNEYRSVSSGISSNTYCVRTLCLSRFFISV